MASYILANGGNFYLAFEIAAVTGMVLGMLNAALVYFLKVPAIIITIAMLNVYFGLLIYFSNGDWLYGFPDWFMNGVELLKFTGSDGYDYSLNLPILVLLGVIALTALLMGKTRIGRQIYAMGATVMPRAVLASIYLASTCLCMAIWVRWRGLPQSCKPKSPSRWHPTPSWALS